MSLADPSRDETNRWRCASNSRDMGVRTEQQPRRILAMSGSLRRVSSNTALVHAAAALVPHGVEVLVYPRLAALPLFNPDLDGDTPPAAVVEFRLELDGSDAVLISS